MTRQSLHHTLAPPALVGGSGSNVLDVVDRVDVLDTADVADAADTAETVMTAESAESERIEFIMEMASALSAFGSPAHRVEAAMAHCAAQLGLEASFFSLPTAVHAMFGSGAASRTVLRRVPAVSVNLERLVELDELRRDVAAGVRSATDGRAGVRRLLARPARYTGLTTIAACAVVSGACAILFQGGPAETLVAATIGLAVGVLDHVGTRFEASRRLLDFLSGFLATIVACGFAAVAGPVGYDVALLAGLIVLMPGLTVTMAIKELSTLNLVAGTARLVGALTVLAMVGFGVAVGYRLFGFGLATQGPPAPVTAAVMIIAVFAAGLSLAVLLRVRMRDVPAVLAIGALGYAAATLGTDWIGAEPGVCLAAATVGLASNFWSRLRRIPAVVTMVPGIILLVPGSTGFRGVFAFLSEDSIAAVDAGLSMIITATALVSGLLLANATYPSRSAV